MLCWYSVASAAPIYVIRRSDGSVTFTSKSPTGAVKSEIFNPSGPKFSYYRSARSMRRPNVLHNEFHEFILHYAHRYGVDPHLVKGVIHAESGFNPGAVSPKGARGLMQLMPGTQQQVGVQNAFSPQQNIAGGVKYLSQMIGKYRGDVRLALAAYNAGPASVDRYGGIPPFAETQEYVRRVLFLAQSYRSRYATP